MTNQSNPVGLGTAQRKPPKRTEAEWRSWVRDAAQESDGRKKDYLEAVMDFHNGIIDAYELDRLWRLV